MSFLSQFVPADVLEPQYIPTYEQLSAPFVAQVFHVEQVTDTLWDVSIFIHSGPFKGATVVGSFYRHELAKLDEMLDHQGCAEFSRALGWSNSEEQLFFKSSF